MYEEPTPIKFPIETMPQTAEDFSAALDCIYRTIHSDGSESFTLDTNINSLTYEIEIDEISLEPVRSFVVRFKTREYDFAFTDLNLDDLEKLLTVMVGMIRSINADAHVIKRMFVTADNTPHSIQEIQTCQNIILDVIEHGICPDNVPDDMCSVISERVHQKFYGDFDAEKIRNTRNEELFAIYKRMFGVTYPIRKTPREAAQLRMDLYTYTVKQVPGWQIDLKNSPGDKSFFWVNTTPESKHLSDEEDVTPPVATVGYPGI